MLARRTGPCFPKSLFPRHTEVSGQHLLPFPGQNTSALLPHRACKETGLHSHLAGGRCSGSPHPVVGWRLPASIAKELCLVVVPDILWNQPEMPKLQMKNKQHREESLWMRSLCFVAFTVCGLFVFSFSLLFQWSSASPKYIWPSLSTLHGIWAVCLFWLLLAHDNVIHWGL